MRLAVGGHGLGLRRTRRLLALAQRGRHTGCVQCLAPSEILQQAARAAGLEEVGKLIGVSQAGLHGPLHLAAVGQPRARERIRLEARRLGLVDSEELVAVA